MAILNRYNTLHKIITILIYIDKQTKQIFNLNKSVNEI